MSAVLADRVRYVDFRRLFTFRRHRLERRLDELGNDTGLLLWALDTEANCTVSNQRINTFAGTRHFVLGTAWLDLMHPDDRDVFNPCFCQSGRRGFSLPIRMEHVSAGFRWLSATWTPIWSGAGAVVAHLVAAIDLADDSPARVEDLEGVPYRVVLADVPPGATSHSRAGVIELSWYRGGTHRPICLAAAAAAIALALVNCPGIEFIEDVVDLWDTVVGLVSMPT